MNFFKLIVFCLFLWGCATEKPAGKTEAEVLYKEALNLMEDERYLMATEKLNYLKNQYPYSFYATPAELLQADILFRQESFVDAAVAYILFKDFHPKHEKIAYVVFRIAESYYNQLPDTFDRDLESAVEAIKHYSELIEKYPASKHIADAKIKIGKAQDMLRNKEQYIADFYFKTEQFSAARWRYLVILNEFENKKLRSHAMRRIIISTYHMNEFKKCIDYLGSYSPHLSKKDLSTIGKYGRDCKNKI